MLVITFDPNEHNFIMVGEKSYSLFRLPDGNLIMIYDRCAHRGGPLHLGCWDGDKGSLVCPWHQTSYTQRALVRRAQPMVYNGNRVTVVLSEPPETPFHLIKKNILVAPALKHVSSEQSCEVNSQW